MEKQKVMNYESRENCFKKCEHVVSRLVYGDPSFMPEPWLTVLVPTYKRVELLREALESVLTQYHTDFFWDVVVVDNEPDDGQENDTERLIREIDNPRILYYRNSENIRPGDNFNRGFLLSRGKWVTMLHDDDLLVANTLQNLEKLILRYDRKEAPLGAIAAQYIQFEYDAVRNEVKADIPGMNQYLCDHSSEIMLYHLTHRNVEILGHIGGSVPSNGSTFLRKAVMDAGGFNEDYGISGDLILFYNIENEYRVYQTLSPLGFYRWGNNSMIKRESTFRVVRDGFQFREYVYQKKKLIGVLFRNCHYRKFTTDVIKERNQVSSDQMLLQDFDEIYSKRPNPLWFLFYRVVIGRAYTRYKRRESKRLARITAKEQRE
ncbi:MAG: glycosyltransferase family 2 protein [Oscillospiraceae bacterium]|nr:glycosyltransferase family 2 protein [Oscillospiraceae bacterium]